MRTAIIGIFWIGLLVQPAKADDVRPVATTVIENVTVISAHLDQAQENMDVLIRGGHILDVIETGTDYPAEQQIDGRGKFLIPGLIDSHVHLGHNPMIGRDDPKFENLNIEYKRQLPRSLLFYGFTSVVDLDYSPERNGWLPDTEQAPNVYHCGRGVRFAGGYGPAFVPLQFVHRAFPNMIFEPQHSADWPEALNASEYTVEAAVQRVTQSGAICLKTYVESGFGGVFDWSLPSPGTLSALSDTAKKNGLVFVVHANGADAWQRAVAAGAEVIAHGLWHWDGDRRNSELTSEAQSAIERAVQAGVAVQPTLRVVEGERATLRWDLIDDSRVAGVLTAGVVDYLREPNGRWSRDVLLELYRLHNPYPDVSPSALIDVSVKRVRDSLLKFHQSGGTLLLGTDTPAQDGIGNPPGLNGYLEMEGWAKAGIPLERIFRAATLDNARTFHIDHEVGSVEPGKQADLLLLGANPLESITAYDDISVVIVDGIPIDRDDLSAKRLDVAVTP
jgi:imidazolonepropionase-like amidohydrolase